MAKFYGDVGFIQTVETDPGIWEPQETVHKYYGDWLRNFGMTQGSGGVNDNVNIANKLSIISDPYANQNFGYMRYVEYMGNKWKVTQVESQYPRLILTIGGLYNGEPITATE